jgi:hypothetical protein
MSKTIVAIVAVLAVFAVLYMTMSSELQELGASTQLSGMPREGNGLAGRFIGYIAESTWYPLQFSLGLSLLIAFSAGMVFYWRRIQD